MLSAALTRLTVLFWLALSPAPLAAPAPANAAQAPGLRTLTLPGKEGSVRFAVLGDSGTGGQAQYDVAKQMAAFHADFPFEFVIMLGDNIYGSDTPAEMASKFSTPYKALLDAGVVFRAALGNHDNPSQRFYTLFNMGGERYYTFRVGKGDEPAETTEPTETSARSVRFLALDSGYLDKTQLEWLEKTLSSSSSDWKIAFFHHPLYSSGKAHGSSLESRALLEPLFVKYGVNAVFSGHDHVYERIKPQKGITYWVSGAGGKLRKGGLGLTQMTAKGFDRDYHFMLVEIAGDDLYFQAISRTGATVDSGVIHRSSGPAAASAASTRAPLPAAAPAASPGVRSKPEGGSPAVPSP